TNGMGRSHAALGKTPRWFAGRLERIGIAKLELLLPAALEDAQDVAWLAQREAWQRINECQNAVLPCHLRRHRNRAVQTQRHAIQPISLAEAIILGRVRAVVIERRYTQHCSGQ